jgi:hypothetical protein
MKPLLCLVLLATATLAEEPAIEVLIADSPIIVVAEPVFEKGFPPLGECSEIVLVKYSVKFKIRKVLKTDRELKADDIIFTRLAVHLEWADEDTFELKEGHSMILFLRKTEYEKESFENTSIWFGVMPCTKQKELLMGFAVKEAADKKP